MRFLFRFPFLEFSRTAEVDRARIAETRDASIHEELRAEDWRVIDRSLPQDVAQDDEKHFLFVKTVEMAEGPNKEVMVEGIESHTQLDLAISTGADLVQGYFSQKPWTRLRRLHMPCALPASAPVRERAQRI